MDNILNFKIGLILGLLNERNNQFIDLENKNKTSQSNEEVIQGDGKMLMNM